MSCVLAIDQGTSGTKAIVVDDGGSVLAIEEVGVQPVYLDDGGVEIDPQSLLDSVLLAGRRALERSGAAIEAVALSNQGETVLLWDRSTGEPLSQAIVWQDRRAEGICRALADHADTVATATGLVLDPYFSAPKMRWLRDRYGSGGVVTTTDSWLVHRLCGAFVTDASTASRSLVYHLDRGDWDAALLQVFGLEDEPLPQVVASDEIVGTTAAFGTEVPVTGLIVDQQAALLAESCFDAGTAKCTYGTGAFLLAQVGRVPVRSSAGLTTSVAWRLRGQDDFCVDGQVYTAASAVRWICELGLVPDAAALDETAADEANGVLCVPALAGLAAPWWSSDATASFTGMTLASGRGHLVRAVLEGIAAQVSALTALIADDLEAPLTRLRVDGGLTRSRVLMQAQADLSQLPIDVYPSPHATPLGAAACARMALDRGLALADSVRSWEPSQTYEPRWSADRAADFIVRWRTAAEACVPEGTPVG